MSGESTFEDSSSDVDHSIQNIPIPPELIQDIPEEKREEFIQQISEYFLHVEYSSPIPPSREVAGYEQLLPGSADRILAMAEQRQRSEIEMEKQRQKDAAEIERTLVATFAKREIQGMWLGAGLALVMMASGTLVILSGFGAEGFSLAAAPVIAIATAFVYSHRSGRKERRDREAMEKAASPELSDGGKG